MEYSKEKLDQLHSSLLEILDYIDSICRKNNLEYFLIGGTALGAKRHHGFIPWDDDLDIGMPRKDYIRFKKIMYACNDPLYKIQDEKTEPNYFLPFAKLRKQGTVFREYVSKDLYKDNGLFIDIFPFDTFNKINSLDAKISFAKISLIKHQLRFRYCGWYYKEQFSKYKYFGEEIRAIPYLNYSREELFNKLDELSTKQDQLKANYVGNLGGTFKTLRAIMPYNIYYPLKTIEFEGKMYPCVNDVDSYLTNIYGDYMKLPPVEQRRTHEPLELIL